MFYALVFLVPLKAALEILIPTILAVITQIGLAGRTITQGMCHLHDKVTFNRVLSSWQYCNGGHSLTPACKCVQT